MNFIVGILIFLITFVILITIKFKVRIEKKKFFNGEKYLILFYYINTKFHSPIEDFIILFKLKK